MGGEKEEIVPTTVTVESNHGVDNLGGVHPIFISLVSLFDNILTN